MEKITVSQEQNAILSLHLAFGHELIKAKTTSTEEQIAWMRKCATLLHVLSPRVSTADFGVIGRFFGDLRAAIDTLASGKLAPMDHNLKAGEEFRSAVANLEGLIDCINVAPQSVLVPSCGVKHVNPYFPGLPESQDDALVFVLMPFAEPWSDRMCRSHIKRIVEALGIKPPLHCKRADDLYGEDVLRDIVTAINAARLVLADITGRNPNVFYELGIAHWIGKRVILLTQSAEDIPFDLLRFRHIVYEDNSDGYRKLEEQLGAAVLETFA